MIVDVPVCSGLMLSLEILGSAPKEEAGETICINTSYNATSVALCCSDVMKLAKEFREALHPF